MLLSACIVVKNETGKLEKLLTSLIPFADQFVFVDTGSTDGTPDFIRKFCDYHKLTKRLKLIEAGPRFNDADGDFNFGAAKQFAFDNADADYVFWLDANEKLTNPIAVRKIIKEAVAKTPEMYFTLFTQVGPKAKFPRNRCGPRLKSHFTGMVHEVFSVDNMREIPHLTIPHPIENFKQTRDINRNLKLLLKVWRTDRSPRTAFYLAQSFKETGRQHEAVRWYVRRAYAYTSDEEMFPEEKYKAMEGICECLKNGDSYQLEVANDMCRYAPRRFEGYFYRAVYYMARANYQRAMNNLMVFEKCPYPKKSSFWINDKIYDKDMLSDMVSECAVAIKNAGVRKPDSITDYLPGVGSFSSAGTIQ